MTELSPRSDFSDVLRNSDNPLVNHNHNHHHSHHQKINTILLIIIMVLLIINTITQFLFINKIKSEIGDALNLIDKFNGLFTEFSHSQNQLSTITKFIPSMVSFVRNSETFYTGVNTCITKLGICS